MTRNVQILQVRPDSNGVPSLQDLNEVLRILQENMRVAEGRRGPASVLDDLAVSGDVTADSFSTDDVSVESDSLVLGEQGVVSAPAIGSVRLWRDSNTDLVKVKDEAGDDISLGHSQLFFAQGEDGYISLGAAWDSIDMDYTSGAYFKDSFFTHSQTTNPEQVTLTQAGMYLCSYSINVVATGAGGTTSVPISRVVINSGAVPASNQRGHVHNVADAGYTLVNMFPLEADAGDVLELQVREYLGSPATTGLLTAGARLFLMYLRP